MTHEDEDGAELKQLRSTVLSAYLNRNRADPNAPFLISQSPHKELFWLLQLELRILAVYLSPKPSRVRRNASYLIHLFYRDQKKADAVIGDLDELFDQRLKRYGKRRAIWWYRAQVSWSLIDLLFPLVRRISGLAAARELWHRILSR
jgi:hypothetical protein